MSDIKKKFLDILFEQETEEIEAEAPLVDVKVEKKEEVKHNEKKESIKSPNVKDVLYGKQDKPSSFIDYFEVPKREKPVDTVNEAPYEMRDNVSPIFGPITQKEKKKKTATEKEIQKAVSSATQEYTGIVISPIYGYDTSKANDARKQLLNKPQKIEDTGDYLYDFDEPAFEIPEDMTETIKEAIQEAVVELNPSSNPIIEQNIQEEIVEEQTSEDVYEDPIEELNFENDIQEEPYEEPQVEEEVVEEPVVEEDGLEEVQNIFDSFEEPVEEIKEETFEEPEELFENVEEQTQDIPVQQEDTQEIPKQDEFENVQKPNRSIYDTTPIQLFDFDELTEKDNKDTDLFDELIGDDD